MKEAGSSGQRAGSPPHCSAAQLLRVFGAPAMKGTSRSVGLRPPSGPLRPPRQGPPGHNASATKLQLLPRVGLLRRKATPVARVLLGGALAGDTLKAYTVASTRSGISRRFPGRPRFHNPLVYLSGYLPLRMGKPDRGAALTWLHVSDLHFGHGDAHQRFDQVGVTNAIIEHAKGMASQIGEPDLILVTGDVAFSAQSTEYAQAKAWLQKLRQSVGGTPRVFVIPGNHDVNRKTAEKIAPAALHRELRKDHKKLNELLLDSDQMQVIWSKFSEFTDFCKEFEQPGLTAGAPFFAQEIQSPVGGKLIVVGLNTSLLCFDNADSPENLALGRGQLLQAIESQPNDALLLVLQHHPADWLCDGDQLATVLGQHAHIQFSGHVHKQRGILQMPLFGGASLQLVAGAGHKDMKEEGHHAYAWGQLDTRGLSYHPWSWNPELHCFVPMAMAPTADFKADNHAFVELGRLPRAVRQWLGPQQAPVSKSTTSEAQPPTNAVGTGAEYNPGNSSFYVPYRAVGDRLVGRDAALATLATLLTESEAQIGRIALSGIGGLGKTQLAAEYCHRHKDRHHGGIYWLDASQNLEGQVIALCDRAKWLHPDSEHANKLAVGIHRLRRHQNSLLVFDNVEDLKDILSYLPEHDVSGTHVLVLSRAEIPGWSFVPLNPLDAEESIRLLESLSGRVSTSTEEKAAAHAIAEQLDGLPLALELVGAYLKRRPVVTWKDCADDLKRRGTDARSLKWEGLGDASFTKHGPDLHAALSLDESILSPVLRCVLDVLAWAGTAPMGRALLSTLAGNPEPGDLVDALGLSEQLRILSVEHDPRGEQRFRLHRLVQQVRQQDVARPEGELLSNQVRLVSAFFEARRKDFGDLTTYEAELPHLLAFYEHARLSNDWASIVRLRWLQAYPPHHWGRFRDAHEIVQGALDDFVNHHLTDKTLEAELRGDLGATFGALGQHQEGLTLTHQALDLRREVLGEKHPDTVTSLSNLGVGYACLGHRQEALVLEKQALDTRREILGDKHPDTAIALGNLGSNYDALGQHQKAKELKEEALEIRREVLGEKHPATADALLNLGATYSALRQYNEALKFAQQALDICRQALGEKHPRTAEALSNVGVAYCGLGQHHQALESAQQGLDISREVLGEKHPRIATVLVHLSTIHDKLGQHQEALKLAQDALDIRRLVLGEKHPDTATAQNRLVVTYFAMRKYGQALACARQVLTIRLERLGPQHPDTAAIRINLARCQKAIGQGVEALRTVQTGIRSTPTDIPEYTALVTLLTELRNTKGPLQRGWRQPPKTGKPRKR